ncbi:Glutathione S-transferase [Candidatus Burkholderia pumila]|uniref:Glutathione S-transferase n=1 Tax=Candidatus Burkholderia pumila TaxID=1090375 RepID=A0ABR5HMX0_9BURK|nr:Glutathione S-transferase [Candidatus Burkholderia pumila]
MKLVIGDKNFSSWSMRPWILLKHFGIAFDEVLIPLYRPESKAKLLKLLPTSKVPCLTIDAGDVVWESLAVVETLAEAHTEQAMWPRDAIARAHARSVSAEMHVGFAALRENMPMDICKRATGHEATPEALANIACIEALWGDCLAKFDGPFLFGKSSIADAMFAPVVTRFISYGASLNDTSRAYCERVIELPAVVAWIADAREETKQ